MEEYQIELIRNKSYQDLTFSEKEVLKDWFTNEEEFLDLQHLFVGVQTYKFANEQEIPTRKKELDDLFTQVHSTKPAFDWKNFFFPIIKPIILQPGFQLAFGLVFLVGISYFLSTQIPQTNTNLKAKRETTSVKKDKKEKVKVKSEIPIVNKIKNKSEDNLILPDLLNEGIIKQTAIASTINYFEQDVEKENVAIAFSEPTNLGYFSNQKASSIADDQSLVFSKYVSENTKDTEYKTIPFKPVSEQPEILDLLFATY